MKARDIVHDYAQGRLSDEEAVYRLIVAYKAGETFAYFVALSVMEGIAVSSDPDHALRTMEVAGHA